MLSRVAESLYWIGRYVERAEDTSRLLDVHVHTLIEDPWVDEHLACRDVLSVMGVPLPEGRLDARRTTERLAFDRGDTSSIVGALSAARENARGVREALSSELWEALNATYHALPAQQAAAERHGPGGLFRYVRERAAFIGGLLDGTMPRDDGWRFLVLGRSLERVDMTARLLWARGQQRGASSGWIGLLKSCSAHEAYLRTYRAAVEPEKVVEFLNAYKAKHGTDRLWGGDPNIPAPSMGGTVAGGYDGMLVMADAWRRAGSTDPAATIKAMDQTKGFLGVNCTYEFTPEKHHAIEVDDLTTYEYTKVDGRIALVQSSI